MTNYNERLDEILELLHNSWLDDDYEAKDPDAIEAKQAITSLIKELVAEAKPEEHIDVYTYSNAKTNDDIRKIAINEFEQNLDKILAQLRNEIEWCIDPQRLSGVYVDRERATKAEQAAKAALQNSKGDV